MVPLIEAIEEQSGQKRQEYWPTVGIARMTI